MVYFAESQNGTSDDLLILSDVEGSSTETEADLELHKCSAYEIVKLSQQRIEMETNPAYGEVGQFHRQLSEKNYHQGLTDLVIIILDSEVLIIFTSLHITISNFDFTDCDNLLSDSWSILID